MKLSEKEKLYHTIAEATARAVVKARPWVSYDEMYQESWVAMLSAKNFDETKGVALRTYLSGAARMRCNAVVTRTTPILSGGRYRTMEKIANIGRARPESMDEYACGKLTQAELALSKRLIMFIEDRLVNKYKYSEDKVRWILLLLTKEMRPKEVAKEFNVRRQAVYDTIKEVRRKLREDIRRTM